MEDNDALSMIATRASDILAFRGKDDALSIKTLLLVNMVVSESLASMTPNISKL